MDSNNVFEIKMTLSDKGFTLQVIEHTLLKVLDNGLLELPLGEYTRYVIPVQKESKFSIQLIEGSITYVLEYFTTSDSEYERSHQRSWLKVKTETLYKQTERAIFLCP